MPIRWDPDDPRWIKVEPDLRTVDLSVLRQVGIPEPILLLAVRDQVPGTDCASRGALMGGYRRYTDLSFVDDVDECDPDPFACYDRDIPRRW